MASDLSLPECDYRTTAEGEQHFVCKHSRVRVHNGIVTAEVCMHCSSRTLPAVSIETHNRPIDSLRRMPNVVQRAWNVAIALSDFIADGCRTLTSAEFEERLKVCEVCELRMGNSCTECGCRLAIKARGRAFSCPIGKWAAVQGTRSRKIK